MNPAWVLGVTAHGVAGVSREGPCHTAGRTLCTHTGTYTNVYPQTAAYRNVHTYTEKYKYVYTRTYKIHTNTSTPRQMHKDGEMYTHTNTNPCANAHANTGTNKYASVHADPTHTNSIAKANIHTHIKPVDTNGDTDMRGYT